jgi:LacI family transcriptional regulator
MVRSEDVAKHAGVSRATVSVVLNGRTDIQIPEETRQRVLAAATALGYRPHRAGRAMRSGKTGNIAFLLSTFAERSLFTPRLLDGLMDGAAQHDHHLLVARLDDTQFVPKLLREFAADGVVLNYNSQVPGDLAERLAQAKLPAVWINDKREHDAVYPDDFQGAQSATEDLIRAGHTQIGYIGWAPGPHYSMADRVAGYRAAMTAHGLPERAVLLGQTSAESLLPGCTAVLCYTPDVLDAAYRLCPQAELVTICATPYRTLDRSISTWLLPDYELGANAIEMLMAKLGSPETPLPARALPLRKAM